MYQFSRPQAAREIEARARARRLSVRVVVLKKGQHYQTTSQSDPSKTYDLWRHHAGWDCSCSGFFWTGACKHLGQLARRADREGWDFGRVAPRNNGYAA